jgi:hypothetical protein
MTLFLPIVAVAGAALAAILYTRQLRAAREEYLRHYTLPKGLFEKLQARHPDLSRKDCELVAQGLHQFFLAYLHGGFRFVSMPSQVVDDLWHEFILYTRNYQHFCRKAFGRFMHHTPAVVMGADRQNNAGLRRCWWHACRDENIDPRKPTRLPLLFALDSKLNIPGGFTYVPDCSGVRRDDSGGGCGGGTPWCGGDFSDSSFDGGTDGFGDSGGGDGGGGGDGCGGGCGGGD